MITDKRYTTESNYIYIFREILFRRYGRDFNKMVRRIRIEAKKNKIDLSNYQIIVRPEIVVIDKRKVKDEK